MADRNDAEIEDAVGALAACMDQAIKEIRNAKTEAERETWKRTVIEKFADDPESLEMARWYFGLNNIQL